MKLSIITVNLNNRNGLQKTIDSVVSQTFRDFEWIVIDGGSTDGSKELIEQYAEHFAYWVSEPDKGIYNAMNKGIKVAKGEYLQFLNSGDWLLEASTLQKVFDTNPKEGIVYGDCVEPDGSVQVFPSELDALSLYGNMLNHQASFIKRVLFDDGGYDESFRYVSDWLFYLEKIVFENVGYLKVNVVVVGVQSGKSYDVSKSNAERRVILEKFFSPLQRRALDRYAELAANPMRTYYDYIDDCPKLKKWVRRMVRLHRKYSRKKS